MAKQGIVKTHNLYMLCCRHNACGAGSSWAFSRELTYQTWRACPEYGWLDWFCTDVLQAQNDACVLAARLAADKLYFDLLVQERRAAGKKLGYHDYVLLSWVDRLQVDRLAEKAWVAKDAKKCADLWRKTITWKHFKRLCQAKGLM